MLADSYELDQSTPGTLIGLSCMLSSIGCAIAGAYWQTVYEHELHLNEPDRFPPNPILHFLEQRKKKKNKRQARQASCDLARSRCHAATAWHAAHRPAPRHPLAHYTPPGTPPLHATTRLMPSRMIAATLAPRLAHVTVV